MNRRSKFYKVNNIIEWFKTSGYNVKVIVKGIFSGSMPWLHCSFSQEGEDMILDNLLEFMKEGFHVDIGAYHPTIIMMESWGGIQSNAVLEANGYSLVAFTGRTAIYKREVLA